jgi:diguanylate cyclase (GGDEF)-like protein
MSLRKKVVGVLLLVFALYGVTASLVLNQLQGRSYIELEQRAIVEQLLRARDVIRIHGDYVENLVFDWAYWNDSWLYAQGKNDDFYDENLAGGYLGTLGFDFVIVLDRDGNAVFEEAYSDKQGTVDSTFSILPNGISSVNDLIESTSNSEYRGWISTKKGPALFTASEIYRDSGSGPTAGHFILGRVLNQKLLKDLSTSIHSKVDLLPVDQSTTIPAEFQAAIDELLISAAAHVMVKTDEDIYAMTLLKSIDDLPIAALRVGIASDITALGESSMKVSIVILVLAALIVTACLWALLQGIMLSPIERLTKILRKLDESSASGEANHQLSGAAKALGYWRDSMSVAARGDEIGELVGAFQKMSTSLDDAASRIWVLAHVDELSNLANRRLFTEQLSDKLEQAKNQFTQIAVMFVDLDDFKPINDRLGHRAGDGVLIDFAWRLNLLLKMPATIGKNQYSQLRDLPARIGGDEFVIMLSGDDLSERAPEVAAKIIYAASTPFEVAGELFSISASAGLAVFPEDSDTVEALLHNADTAMYEAKRSGKNVWVKYHN